MQRPDPTRPAAGPNALLLIPFVALLLASPLTAQEPEELTLDQAISFALEHNPRVASAAAEVQGARARITQRKALRGPQFGVNNFIYRQGPVVPSFRAGDPPSFPPYRWNVGIFVSQVLFDWGERSTDQKAAEAEARAAGHRQGEVLNDVSLVVAVAFYNVLRARELVEVAGERLRSTAEQLRVTRARFEADVSPRFDVLRSEAEAANAEQELIEARNDLAISEAAFNTALGREVTSAARLRPEPAPNAVDLPFETLRETAFRRRPQLQALEALIGGSELNIRARRAENKPRVTLNSAYDRPNPGGFASQQFRYNAGLVMSFPFFDSGFVRGRVREAEAAREADTQALQLARQQVELDVRRAQLDLQEARQRIDTARKEQSAARESLRVAEVRYRAGVGTNVEVTDAQVAVARAGQNLANAQFDHLTAIVRLRHATGELGGERGTANTAPKRDKG